MPDVRVGRRADGFAGLIFSATTLLSSLLTFAVEPMVGKALLPALGGGATVWTSVMLFFQCVVLAGYALTCGAIARIGPARAALLLVALAITGLLLAPVVPVLVSPPVLQDGRFASGAGPALAVFLTLASGYGLACVTLSAATPAVQAWFGALSGREPYRLYALSNAGSLLGLALYPAVLEPTLSLGWQGALWRGAFAGWTVLLILCAALVVRSPGQAARLAPRLAPRMAPRMAQNHAAPRRVSPTWRRRGAWLVLALVPSSLLLGVTQHITIEIAPIPLLWVAPLAVYLLTFIAAFAAPQASLRRGRLYQACFLPLVMVFAVRPELDGNAPVAGIATQLAAFAGCALLCHGRLAMLRPDPARLTEFYLIVAIGGALGGIVNVILAPLLLDRLLEYPMMLTATCLIMPPLWTWARRASALPVFWQSLAPAAAIGAIILALVAGQTLQVAWLDALRMAAVPLVAVAAGLASGTTRLGFTAAAAIALLVPLYVDSGVAGPALFVTRDFYGPLQVTERDGARRLVHGTTLHGLQRADDPTRPTSYYAPLSGIGRLITLMTAPGAAAAAGVPDAERPRVPDAQRPGLQGVVIGLGAGTLACSASPRLGLSFIELDPAVVDVARRYFSFLHLCGDPPVETGDGRLLLAARPEAALDLIVMDAFSSDAVPAHLITAEAIGLALRKLRKGGVIAVHISNNYLDLAPVIAGSAAANGRVALRFDARRDEVDTPSTWAVLSDDRTLLARLRADGWTEIPPPPASRVWHDDRWTVMHSLKLFGAR